MRYRTLTSLFVLLILVACSGGEKAPADTAVASAAPDAPPPALSTPATSAAQVPLQPGTAAAITGAIIEVRMIGDAKGYRFEPQHITAKSGDGVKFVVVSGGPHEIAFDLASVPAESRDRLQWNMPNATNGRSPLLVAENETWTVSLGGLKPGRYPFVSTPRLPQGMKGEIEVR